MRSNSFNRGRVLAEELIGDFEVTGAQGFDAFADEGFIPYFSAAEGFQKEVCDLCHGGDDDSQRAKFYLPGYDVGCNAYAFGVSHAGAAELHD
jgi:hypothetical protein